MREPRPSLRGGNGLVYRSRSFSRREALKLGALGSAGLLLPLERYRRRGRRKERQPHRVERSAGAVHRPVRPAARVVAGAHGRHDRLLPPGPATGPGRDPAGLADDDLGLQRHRARPDDHGGARAGRSSSGRSTRCRRSTRRSVTRRGRRRTCTGRRRCRSTTATPATSRTPGSARTTTTRTSRRRARSGTTTTASTSPRRTPTWGSPACTTSHDDLERALAIPQRRRTTCRSIITDAMFTDDGRADLRRQRRTRACTATSSSSTAGRGRRCGSSGASTASGCSTRRSRAPTSYACRTGDPFTVIGTDGGLMPAPQAVTDIRHGMAERYEIVIDFSKYPAGQRVVLQNTTARRTTSTSPTPTRSWRSTSSATPSDTDEQRDPDRPQPGQRR